MTHAIPDPRAIRHVFSLYNAMRAFVALVFLAAFVGELAAASDAKPALWKLHGDGVVAHLFGSVHLGKRDLYPLPEPIDNAFAAATHLVVELDIDGIGSAERRAAMAAHGMNPDGITLSVLAGPVLWGNLGEACVALDISCPGLERLRPWLAALTLALRAIERSGLDTSTGVDRHFLRRGRGSHTIVSLETLDGQLSLLSQLGGEDQLGFLEETVEQIGEAPRLIGEIYTSWRAGDEVALDRLVNDELRSSTVPGMYDTMMVQRNASMAAGVARMARAGHDVFVVVGAGHLVGPDSVVKHLLARGWRVERVRY
jgi:uncharacterized protein